ncbi:MAG: helix-hairpin-helix domain-containing protein [Acidobacteriota bacterium]|nr:MAG: helix-hairpin-helix domain-containing protein [Acidobacteriota bacterium]
MKERTISRYLLIMLLLVLPSLAGARHPQNLPDGPGKEELIKLCSQCHELGKSYSLRQDRAGWTRTMQKMAAFGMKSTQDDYNAVLEYLIRNYPADEVPKINVNKARAIDFESGLSLKRSQAMAIIRYRDQNGPFKTIDDLKKVPGIDIEKVEAKKDRLIFEE